MSQVETERLSNASQLQDNIDKFIDQQVQVYTTSIYTTLRIEKKVRAVVDFLEAHGIDHKLIDMCFDLEARPRMLELIPEDLKETPADILAPQVFAGDFDYCGDFEGFSQAKEEDLVYTFFKLTPPEGTAEYIAAFPEPSEPSEPEPESEEEEEEPEIEAQELEEQKLEEQELEEQKEYDPEVAMDGGNIEDTQMFQAVMEQTTDKDVIELSVSASDAGEKSDHDEVSSEDDAASVIENERASQVSQGEEEEEGSEEGSEVESEAESAATVSEVPDQE